MKLRHKFNKTYAHKREIMFSQLKQLYVQKITKKDLQGQSLT